MSGQSTADVVVIGGAVIGSAIAWALSETVQFKGKVVVLEKDPSYGQAASSLSTSGIRQQFSSAVNVELSRYTASFLKDVEKHLGRSGERSGVTFHEKGYLYLGGEGTRAGFEANNALQRKLGVEARLLDGTELGAMFPWLTLDDVETGSFIGRDEGWLDGYLLMQAFRRCAKSNGVEYRHAEAFGIDVAHGRVSGVHCADGSTIITDHVVNASGGGGRRVAEMAGLEIPVQNVKQMVFNFESPVRQPDMPYVFTPDRLFFRPEGRDYIAGLGIPADHGAECEDFEVDYQLFENEIWPKAGPPCGRL